MSYSKYDRRGFSLNTIDGDRFDQVVAMSQGVMNRSFERLLKDLPGVAQMYWDDDYWGSLNAVMDAPRILLKGNTSNTTEAYYQLRIKSGTATLRSKRVLDLSGWVLTVWSPLNEVTLSIAPDDPEDVKEKKKENLANLQKTYKGFVPGDYSVQRAFCAISSAKWTEPMREQSWCTVPDPKDPSKKLEMSLKAFEDSSDKNKAAVKDLCELLSGWATWEAAEHVSTLGIKFEIDKKKIVPDNVTFQPVHIYTQVYPYLSDEFPSGTTGTGKYNDKGIGDYNCLAYCENVDCNYDPRLSKEERAKRGPQVRNLPAQPKLPHTGNLASPALNGKEEIRGSFAMDYRVFLDIFLLPQLQELCQANQLYIGQPERYMAGTAKRFVPHYAIGRRLEGATDNITSAGNPFFAFKKVGDKLYRWEQPKSSNSSRNNPHEYTSESSFLGLIHWDDTEGYGDHDIWSTSKVSVSWNEGDQFLTVSGEIVYRYNIRFAANRDMNESVSEKQYKLTGTWSITVHLNDPKDGVIEPEIRGLKPNTSYPNDITVTPSEQILSDSITGDTQAELTKALQNSLSGGVEKIMKAIGKRFKGAGKLVYPGHGDLVFKNPILTANGSILATADYKGPDGPDGTIFFPEITKTKIEPPTQREPKTETFPADLTDEGEPKLRWVPDFEYDADEKVGRLTLTATNDKAGESLVFQFIKIELLAAAPAPGKAIPNEGLCLFNGNRWEKEHKTLLESFKDWISELKDWAAWLTRKPQEQDAKTGKTANSKPESAASEKTPLLDSPQDTSGAAQVTEKKADVNPSSASTEPGAGNPAEEKKDDGKTSSASTEPKPEPKQERRQPPMSKESYLYALNPDWPAKGVAILQAGLNSASGLIEFTIKMEGGGPFEIPKGKRFVFVLQGKVDAIGQYPIKVHESWKRKTGQPVGQLKEAPYAIDYKVAEILSDGTGTAWDISDRKKQLAEAAAATKTAATPAPK